MAEHNYAQSPSCPKQIEIDKYKDNVNKLKKAKRKLQKQKYQLKKRKSGNELLQQLKKKNELSEQAILSLKCCLGETGLNIFKDLQKDKKKFKFNCTIKKFALTLFSYSPKAYKYIRKVLPALPHPRTLTKWLSTIEGNPGITAEAIASVKRKLEESNHPMLFTLMLDEMALKKQVQWDGKQHVGFVNLGANVDDDSLPVATNALVYLLVPLNGNWKIPVAYYLTDGLKGKVLANLTKNILTYLHNNHINVLVLVFDGCGSNQSLLSELGIKLEYPLKSTCFPHPADPSKTVYVILDNCHMFKLVRNMLTHYKSIKNGKTGNVISWDFIKKLHELQQDEGLRLANKLKRNHIEFASQKMKVNLSVQTLSNSTAQALLCLKKLGYAAFQGCEETVHFIEIMDKLFDLMNSRNPFGKGFKAPLRQVNKQTWLSFLNQAEDYIINLQTVEGVPLYASKRKTSILGYLVMIKNVKSIFEEYIEKEKVLKYILTYKFSQDYIELFFSAVRALNGSNNNPTFIQFKAAYRRLLNIQDSCIVSGNCTPQDETVILNTAEVIPLGNEKDLASTSRKYNLTPELGIDIPDPDDYCMQSQSDSYSPYTATVVTYIAGFVAKKLMQTIVCKTCANALYTTNPPDFDQRFILLKLKDKGGLTYPSKDLLKVTELSEKIFRRYMLGTGGKPTNRKNAKEIVLLAILSHTSNLPLFENIKDHMFDTEVTDNHLHSLCKSIVNTYIQIRFHHEAKSFTSTIRGPNIRNKLTKVIRFKNQ